ncbi:hypothetical protein GCM10017779_14320 [Streptomyces capillispiralis]|nr:hypothetical protein GCM10017779_14320 [Streptomyces capillispiralis]
MGSGWGPTGVPEGPEVPGVPGVPEVPGELAVLSEVPFSALTRRLWLRTDRGLRVGPGSATGAGP